MRFLFTVRKEPDELRNPISILDLAAYARQFGHDVDCYYISDIFAGKIPDKAYDFVGYSVLQGIGDEPFTDLLFLRNTFKKRVVVGGKWVNTLSDEHKEILRKNDIEVFVGHGEKLFSDGSIDYHNYPAWHEVDFKTLGGARPEVMSTRGCPYRCHFCHNTETSLSWFSAERTVENIATVLRLGAKMVFFVDDIFTIKPAHMEAIHNELNRRRINIKGAIQFFTHVNCVSPEAISAMQKFRPLRVEIGIESGDNRMLKAMGKPFTPERAYEKIKLLSDSGIPTFALFLIGFPGETEESLDKTVRFVDRVRPYLYGLWVSYYQPVRGTVGFDMVRETDPSYRHDPRRNNVITYVPPSVTEHQLKKYRRRMFKRDVRYLLRRTRFYMDEFMNLHVNPIFKPRVPKVL